MAKGGINWWVVLVIGILAYAFVPAVQTFVDGIFGGVGGGVTPTQPSQPKIPCPIEDTTVTFNQVNAYAKATAAADGSARVFQNGVDAGYVADGSTKSFSPGDKLTVIYAENSSATGYYSDIEEVTVPCSGTLQLQGELADLDVTPTFTFWTEAGEVMSSSVSENADTDSAYNFPVRIRATSKYSFSNPGISANPLLCIDYNNTLLTKAELLDATSVPVPKQLITGNTTVCFEIEPIPNDPTNMDDGEWNGEIYVETATGFDKGNTSVCVIDADVDLDADTLEIILAVEDEDNNDLGMTLAKSTQCSYFQMT